jgi:hypothetical protein
VVVSDAAAEPVARVARRPGRLVRPARSIIGWILAILVIAAFAAAYGYYRVHEGEWTAGTILALMSVPYVNVAHAIGFPDLDVFGDDKVQVIAATLSSALVAYIVGALIGALARGAWRLAFRR